MYPQTWQDLIANLPANFRNDGKLIVVIPVRNRYLGENATRHGRGAHRRPAIGKSTFVGPAEAELGVSRKRDGAAYRLAAQADLKGVDIVDTFKSVLNRHCGTGGEGRSVKLPETTEECLVLNGADLFAVIDVTIANQRVEPAAFVAAQVENQVRVAGSNAFPELDHHA